MTEVHPNDAVAGDEEQFLALALRYLDGVADAEEEAALARQVHSDPQCRGWFVALCHQLGMLHEVFSARPEEEPHQLEIRNQQSEIPGPEPFIPPIVIDTSSPVPPSLFSIHSPLGGWLISYGVATVLTGMAILGAWAYKVSHDYSPLAANNSRGLTAPGPDSPGAVGSRLIEPELVGRITGTAGCQWTDAKSAPIGRDVALGQAYALSSGLMEINYESGAKVILEGPCVYEVDSPAGGFLSLGKLTARVESAKPEAANPKSQIPNPKFVVKTPTAIVTDLGTEFGVEVDKSGASRAQVFCGRVEVRIAGGDEGAKVISLGRDESARVERGRNQTVTVVKTVRGKSPRDSFAHQMPMRLPIKLFNTGVELKVGDADPHWQIVARSDDPKFKPQAAVVTTIVPIYAENDPAKSQWISTAGDLPRLPNGVTYTFRTTFELAGLFPGSAVLGGWFIADNHVKAIRLNGVQVPVTYHGWDPPYGLFHSFTAPKGFVEGTNTLEVDVENGGGEGGAEWPASPMLLRVETEGSFLSLKSPPANQAKETNP